MYHFECDYACGAAKPVMRALMETNDEQTCGYGEDAHCESARNLIKEKCGRNDIDVQFVVGGTQANLLVIASALRPFEGVLCADSGHINTHETGAVEATGHKVLPLVSTRGKINAEQVFKAVSAHRSDPTHEHLVSPKMVYISQPTEIGTLYTRDELQALYDVCRKTGLFLFIDGARLGYALAADDSIDFAFLASHCDAFTIGGTKVGLLFGEAIVLASPALADSFRYMIKQRGAMLAKGRLLGIQFEAMLKDDAYITLSKKANDLSQQIKNALTAHGCGLFSDTVTNQVFPILPEKQIKLLSEKYSFAIWEKIDDSHSAVRFCCSVVTEEEHVRELLKDIDLVFSK